MSFLFVSALLVLIPVCRLLNIIAHWRSYISYNTPYSLVLSALGALLLILSVPLNLIAIGMICWDIRTDRRRLQEANSLALNPI